MMAESVTPFLHRPWHWNHNLFLGGADDHLHDFPEKPQIA